MTQANGHDDGGRRILRFPRGGRQEPPRPHPQAPEPPVRLPPYAGGLAVLLCLAFAVQSALPYLAGEALAEDWFFSLAFVPARYTGALPFTAAALFAPLTHMFLHGGTLHLAVNAFTLLAFGAGLEKAAGGRRMLAVFFLSGLAGAALHALVASYPEAPMIGASGGISGLFGAAIMQLRAAGQLGGGGVQRLGPFIIIWIGVSVLSGVFGMPGTAATIAWATHVGGFLMGIALGGRMFGSK